LRKARTFTDWREGRNALQLCFADLQLAGRNVSLTCSWQAEMSKSVPVCSRLFLQSIIDGQSIVVMDSVHEHGQFILRKFFKNLSAKIK
jgi:hypothetical protein